MWGLPKLYLSPILPLKAFSFYAWYSTIQNDVSCSDFGTTKSTSSINHRCIHHPSHLWKTYHLYPMLPTRNRCQLFGCRGYRTHIDNPSSIAVSIIHLASERLIIYIWCCLLETGASCSDVGSTAPKSSIHHPLQHQGCDLGKSGNCILPFSQWAGRRFFSNQPVWRSVEFT